MTSVRHGMLIGVFIALLTVGGNAQAPRGWEDLERKGLQFIVDGKGEEAVALLQKFVTANPSFAEGHSMLASAHSAAAESLDDAGPARAPVRRRHLKSAARHYRRTLELTHVNRTLNQLSLAQIYGPGGLNQPAEAEKYAALMVDAHGATWTAQALIGWALSETGRSNDAAAMLRRAREKTPPEDRLKLGVALTELAKTPGVSVGATRVLLAEALATADDAIDRDAANWQAYMFKSLIVQTQAERVEQDPARKAALSAESTRLWEKGRELNLPARAAERRAAAAPPPPPPPPGVPDGWYDKAQELAAAGKFSEAEALARDAVRQYPADPVSHVMLVKVLATMGRSAPMKAALDGARTAVPATPEARQKLGVYLYDVVYRDPKFRPADGGPLLREAAAAFDQALLAKPDYIEALVYKSLALRLQATKFEPDPARAKALVAEADSLRARAVELQKRKR